MERGEEILLTDTVGLIRNLPHMLVESFKSTLDEIKYSDALLIVIDVSDPEFKSQLEVTEQLISELGANELPKIYVFNKCDRGMTEKLNSRDKMEVYISALNGDGLKELESYMYQVINENKHLYKIVLPMDKLSFVDYLYKNASVNNVEYREDGVYIEAVLDKKTKGMVEEFIQ
jgi:GTP-binding protein HflX